MGDFAYSEEQAVDRIETGIAQAVRGLCIGLGVGQVGISGAPVRVKLQDGAGFPHMVYGIYQLPGYGGHGPDSDDCGVRFNGMSYTAPAERELGTPSEEHLPDDGDGFHRVYDASALEIKQTIDVSVTLKRVLSETYNQTVKFGVTNKTSAAVDVDSVKVSDDLTISTEAQFGVTSFSDIESERVFSESLALDVPKGEKVQVDRDVYAIRRTTPVVESAYIDFDMTLELPAVAYALGARGHAKWFARSDGSYASPESIPCASVQELINFIEGRRSIDYPAMANFLPEMRAAQPNRGTWAAGMADQALAGYAWLKDRSNFLVRASKTQVVYQQNAGSITTKAVA